MLISIPQYECFFQELKIMVKHNFEISICYQPEDQQQGWWNIYSHTPDGLQQFKTQRNGPKRYRRLHDALKWSAKQCPGYDVKIEIKCYSGVLQQNRRNFAQAQ